MDFQTSGSALDSVPIVAAASESSTETANRLAAAAVLLHPDEAVSADDTGPLIVSRDSEWVQRWITREIDAEVSWKEL
jgi:hypothetical protein